MKQNTPHSITKRKKLASLLDRWALPPEILLLGTALAVGLSTGVGAVLFRYLIRGIEWLGYTWLPAITTNAGKSYVVFVPAVGGLLVGVLVYFFAREAKGHGVPEVMEAVALQGGRIRPVVAIIKSLASSLCIGSGGSVGREGPIVQIGSALGSSIGQALNLSDERTSNLVACGAAGGIAATFNAPIAGVLFALEVVLGGRFTVRYFSSLVVSAVVASVVGRAVFGDAPAFVIPFEYGINNLWEFLLYPILGILAAFVGIAFVKILYGMEDWFDKWQRVPEWVKPAIGGALLGAVALAYPAVTGISWDKTPQVFNVGYTVIEQVLSNHFSLWIVFALLFLKLLATGLTLGSGGSGGVFAPSLFMGAMLGAAFAQTVNLIFPGLATPGAYALVGMAAVFGAAAHVPITAIIILFELTGDYRIILPLMLTVVVSTVLAQSLLKGESIYTLKLTRRGVRLRRGRDIDILQGVEVREVMAARTETISTTTPISELSSIFTRARYHGLLILDEAGCLWGLVTVGDLEQALRDQKPETTPAADIGSNWPHLKIAFADESIGEALTRMGAHALGQLPVVAREDPYHALGLIRRVDIIKAYNLALTRRAEIQQKTHQMQSEHRENTEFIDIFLKSGDQIIDKAVKDVGPNLPADCVLISIERDHRVIIPHGNTVFRAGDHLTAFLRNEDADILFEYLRG